MAKTHGTSNLKNVITKSHMTASIKVGSNKTKIKDDGLSNSAIEKRRRHTNPSQIIIPEVVVKHLEDHHQETLSNLTRGLKVPPKELEQAQLSLHRARKIVIKKMIAYSYTDSEIIMEIGISGRQLANYKKALYKEEINALKVMTAEEQYVNYRHCQMEVIKDIDVLLQECRSNNNTNVLSNMLKTKSDILRDIATKAQEMGLMTKVADELKVIGGVDLAQLNNEQLNDLIYKQQALVHKVQRGELTSRTEISAALSVDTKKKNSTLH